MANERIMIVEDENIVGLDIRNQVEKFGYGVSGIYNSGESAIAAISKAPPDLVLMDMRLHGSMDGLEAASIIRTEHHLPVVMITAFADEATLERAKTSQPFAYVVKPFDRKELQAAIVMSLYRHKMEQLVVHREQLFSTTLQSIVDAVIVTDMDERIEFMNPVAASLLGLDCDRAIGKRIEQALTFEARGSEPGEDDEGGPGGLTGVDVVVGDTGRRVPVERTVTPVHLANGVQRGWVWVLHDITQRLADEKASRAQEERLARSQKMEAIGRLTGGIAHDFNNLLTVILGYSRLIADDLAGMDETVVQAIAEDVKGIQKAARQSAALTRQLLLFSKNQNVERQVVDLNTVLERMESILRQLVHEDVTVTVDLAAGPAVVYADPSQLEQVVMNLAVNARDAMAAGGRLELRTEVRHVSTAEVAGRDGIEPGEFVTLAVSDTGSGMDEETLLRIFDPFFTTKESSQGTGLGLSTVYGIANQSGGFVDVESRPGHGTVFTVALPARREEEAGAQAVQADPDGDKGEETVLLVEDDDAIRRLAARLLRQKGYRVLDAANPGEALLVSEEHSGEIHLLLSDVVMPLMSGVKLAERLRESRPDVRVILMSGYPDSAVTDEEARRGGFSFLQKPVEPQMLTREVRLILDS